MDNDERRMMRPNERQALITHELGEPLWNLILRHRVKPGEPTSWNRIALEIHDRTRQTITGQCLINWYGEAVRQHQADLAANPPPTIAAEAIRQYREAKAAAGSARTVA